MNAISLSGNFFLVQNNSSAITLQNTAQYTLVGNSFNPASGSPANITGIVIGAWTAVGGIITGNQFYTFTVGINLQSTSKNANVQSNQYIAVSTNIINNCISGCNIGGGTP